MPPGPEIAQPEDALVVGHHHQPDAVGPRRSAGSPWMWSTSSGVIHTPRGCRKIWLYRWHPSPTVGVYTVRQELLEVLDEEPVEDRLVAIQQGDQPDEPIEFVRLRTHGAQFSGRPAPRSCSRAQGAARGGRRHRARRSGTPWTCSGVVHRSAAVPAARSGAAQRSTRGEEVHRCSLHRGRRRRPRPDGSFRRRKTSRVDRTPHDGSLRSPVVRPRIDRGSDRERGTG